MTETIDYPMVAEVATLRRLLEQKYPSGILSYVADTFDLWRVCTEVLPRLHDQIMARDGKLVIRPDSGDPVDIICGTFTKEQIEGHTTPADVRPAEKGVIELLWDEFGGTINEKGYKVLDSHVGLIYGDAMNYERINDICARLEAKGFSMESVVFGLGSFGYQYQTRDTFGFAMKATNVVINGEEKPIFKNPVTDNGLKKSLKGRIVVVNDPAHGGIYAIDEVTDPAWLNHKDNLLTTVWKDGKFVVKVGLDEVRENARK